MVQATNAFLDDTFYQQLNSHKVLTNRFDDQF